VVDIISLANAILDVAEVAEAGNHIGDGYARELAIKIGADDVHDTLAKFVVGVNLDNVDDRIAIKSGVDLKFLGMGALLEEFLILEFLDVFFGDLGSFDERIAFDTGRDFAIGGHKVLSKDTAVQTVIDAKLLGVLETACTAKVITFVIEEFLHEEIDDAVFGDRLARF